MPQQVPGKSLPAAKSKQEQDERDVARLLFQYSPDYLERYRRFQEEHPTLDANLEILSGLHPALETIKRIPDVVEAAQKYKAGTLWPEMMASAAANRAELAAELSAPSKPMTREEALRTPSREEIDEQVHKYLGFLIADPHVKLGEVRKTSENRYVAYGVDTRTGKASTTWTLHWRPEEKQIYIAYATTPSARPAERGQRAIPAYGTGHYMHVTRELAQHMKELHPEAETVQFYRATGAGPNWTGETELVTAPIDLFLPRAERRKGVEARAEQTTAEGEGYPRDPEMFNKMVEGQQKKKSRIVRAGRGGGRRWEPLPEQGRPGRYRVSQQVEERRPYHEHQNSELDDVINQLGDFEAIPETEPSPYADSDRMRRRAEALEITTEELQRLDDQVGDPVGYVNEQRRLQGLDPLPESDAEAGLYRQAMEDDWEGRGEEGPTFAEEDAARARPFRGTPMTMDEFLTDLRNNSDQYEFPHPLGAAVERGEIPVPQSQADIDNFDAQRHERYPEIGDARTHLQVMDQRAQELVHTPGVPQERVWQFEDAHALATERYQRALNEAEMTDERVRAIREIGARQALEPAQAAQAYYEMFSPNPEERPANLDRQISRALDIVYEDPQDQPRRLVPEPIGTGWNEEVLPQEEWPRPAFEQGTRTTLTGRGHLPMPVPREAGGISDEEWQAFLGRGSPAHQEGPRPEPGWRERQDQENRWQARDEQPLPRNAVDRARQLSEERREAEAEGRESYERWMRGLPERERRAGLTGDIDFSQFENPAPTERQREEAAESGLLPGESFDQAYQRQGGAEGFQRWLRGEEDPVGEGVSRQRDRGMFGPTLEETASRQRPLAPHEQTILDRINERWDPGREENRAPWRGTSETDEQYEARQRRATIERERRTPLQIGAPRYAEEDPALGRSYLETREQQQQRLLAGGAPLNDAEREMRRRYLEQQSQPPHERERLRRITPEMQARIDAFAQEVREYPDAYPGGTEMLEAIRRGEAEVPNSQEDIDAWLARRGRR